MKLALTAKNIALKINDDQVVKKDVRLWRMFYMQRHLSLTLGSHARLSDHF
jgi:hypothetical protein